MVQPWAPTGPDSKSLTLDRFGYDSFQEALKISSKAELSKINWERFRFMVFDLPTHNGTYQERYNQLGTNPS